MAPSRFTTTSLGLFNSLSPWWLASTVMLPSASVRVRQLEACSQAISRPSLSQASPFDLLHGLRKVVTPSFPAAQVVTRHIAKQQVAVASMPQWTFRECAATDEPLEGDLPPNDRLEARLADLHPAHDLPALACNSLTRVWPTYQSSAVTSSKTTQMASFGSLATSLMVSVTRRAISSLRSCGWPLSMRMFTNGMATSLH